ncbi:hypothetical protein BJ165DRAFT_1349478 [Panaeolus papilionaceus]|nr:hypothetical protein BJ165DRAFT_1349478 [Panaeolus papilionaceus]
MNPTPLLLRQAYSPIGQDHFYTIDYDEFDRAQHIAYRPVLPTYNPYRLNLHNAIGGAYPTFVPNSLPLFRLFNIGTGDHHYTTDLREIGDAVKVGYELECIAGFVLQKDGEPQTVNVTMGLRRMWSGGKRDHVYLTLDSSKEKDKLIYEGYVDEGVIGRVVPLF